MPTPSIPSRSAGRITKDVAEVLKYGEESVSVSMEEISADDWTEKVSAGHREQARRSLPEAGLQNVSELSA
jgi:phenylpyruvate tautomerase PptA (4-oxalocrotonate tautomerase family)